MLQCSNNILRSARKDYFFRLLMYNNTPVTSANNAAIPIQTNRKSGILDSCRVISGVIKGLIVSEEGIGTKVDVGEGVDVAEFIGIEAEGLAVNAVVSGDILG